jgi:tetratricopeptide (TPR) repeat protein
MATYELGMLYKRAGRADLAVTHLIEAANLTPGDHLLRNNLANALVGANRPAEAEIYLRQAIAIAPDVAETHFNLGNALNAQDKLDEAIGAYEKALALKKPFTKSRLNLGGLLVKLERIDEAIDMYEAGIQEDPGSAEIFNALGVAQQAIGHDDEGLAAFRQAIAIKPELAEAQRNMGLALLMRGDFAAGWDAYVYRWQCEEIKAGWRDFGFPLWRGEHEGTVLVWGEQGIGDKVLYAGMIPDLLARGQLVVMETDARLIALFERSFPGVKVVGKANPPDPATSRGDIRWQTPLADLGRWLRRDAESFAKKTPYLVADPARVQSYRARLEEGAPRAIVGISWKSVHPKIGRHKTLALAQWRPILNVPGVRFVDLQHGDTAAERAHVEAELGIKLTHLEDLDLRDDLDGLAALAAACDLVISVSSTIVHIAAALGRPTWVLVPAAAGSLWYWMRGNTPSPWYATATIFRQPKSADWQPVIADVAARLKDFIAD